MKNKEETGIHMARYMAGEMGMKEEIEFRKRMENNSVLKKELNQMEKSWKYINDLPLSEIGNPGSAWKKLHNRLEADGLLDSAKSRGGRRGFTPILRIAASILVILAIGIPSLWFGLNRDTNNPSEVIQYSGKGVTTIDLPDGSRVYLNEGSKIVYPESFNQERTVKLDGEAFFEVMSDPDNPFVVRSGQVVVSVLGTSFNVKESGDENRVEVFVESGKVRISLENPDDFITLEPGELGRANASTLTLAEQTDPNYISWKTKDFKFVDEELGKVLRELEESYHVEIRTEGVRLSELRITSTYREQSIDSILETIGKAFGLNVQKKEELYYLNP
ncbi:MAG: FecR domain-containing protein [Bacteroidales bacterium]